MDGWKRIVAVRVYEALGRLKLPVSAIDSLLNRTPYHREGNVRRFQGKIRGKTYRMIVELDAAGMVYTVFSFHQVRDLKPGEKPKPHHRRR